MKNEYPKKARRHHAKPGTVGAGNRGRRGWSGSAFVGGAVMGSVPKPKVANLGTCVVERDAASIPAYHRRNSNRGSIAPLIMTTKR